MTRVHGRRTRVWVDGYNLTGDATGLDITADIAAAEVHAFGDDRKYFIPGQEDIVAAMQGLYDNESGSAAHEILRSREGSEVVFSGFYGTAEFSYGWAGTPSGLRQNAIQSPLAAAVTIAGEFGGPIHPVQLLAPEGINSSTGNNLDGTDGSNAGAVAVLQCEGVTQAGTVKVEHSVDGSTAWSDLIDFGNITARTAAIGAASGTVRRYVRSNLAGSATIALSFRRF